MPPLTRHETMGRSCIPGRSGKETAIAAIDWKSVKGSLRDGENRGGLEKRRARHRPRGPSGAGGSSEDVWNPLHIGATMPYLIGGGSG